MGLFGFLTPILSFVENLWKSVLKEWNNVVPDVKLAIETIIKFGNVLKNYIANPGEAGIVIGTLITLAEDAIGSSWVQTILDVLNEALADLEIIDGSLVSDPLVGLQTLLTKMASLGNVARGKLVFELVCSLVEKLVTDLSTNQVKATVAVVYDAKFKSTSAIAA